MKSISHHYPSFACILRICLLSLWPSFAYAQPFAHAHAHNDYEHDRPLFDALHFGFTSVEADVFLVNGRLLVSHTYPLFSSRTLEDLYLAPLDSILKQNQGKIYRTYDGPCYLMIDLKSDGDETYAVLKKSLSHYPTLAQSESVIIFLSGNRPKETVLKDHSSIALDGRPEDLGKGYSREKMPIISDTYYKWSAWNGKGAPAGGDMKRIIDLAARVHGEGKKLRLWAIPDNPVCWKELLANGVDFINTDKLEEFSSWSAH